ncbi:MAG: glycogen synthase [Bacteroidales bacterium]|nr:glycogen synthase [Bacteroidales bacterium]MBD5247459.1 glycogen synthase [Barnesiella sp.]MBD5258535.1 glycogen synthase [Barnesiella sp.]
MDNNKILYIDQEISPYLPESPLADISRILPQAILEKGYEVRSFMPKYGNINERRNQLHEVIRLSGMNIIIDDTDHQLIIKVATLQPSRMQVYFIDNDDYFQHHGVKDIEIRQTPQDNDERIMFYVRGVIETVKKLRWEPSIIQNIGWITALAPLYLKKMYEGDPSFRSSKIVYSLVGDSFEGTLDPRFVEKLLMDGFSKEDLQEIADGPVDCKALNRLAMRYSDGIVQLLPDADPELVEFAKSLGVPFLEYQGEENLAQNYLDFYNKL